MKRLASVTVFPTMFFIAAFAMAFLVLHAAARVL